jgi:hypothetical protein
MGACDVGGDAGPFVTEVAGLVQHIDLVMIAIDKILLEGRW